jgi:hypothetical protein
MHPAGHLNLAMLIRARSHGIRVSSTREIQNEASVFEAILVSQAAVKTDRKCRYVHSDFKGSPAESQERLDNIREHLVQLGDLGRDAVVDGAVANLDD